MKKSNSPENKEQEFVGEKSPETSNSTDQNNFFLKKCGDGIAEKKEEFKGEKEKCCLQRNEVSLEKRHSKENKSPTAEKDGSSKTKDNQSGTSVKSRAKVNLESAFCAEAIDGQMTDSESPIKKP